MIDLNKKYKTRGGEEVRIYAIHSSGPRPVHGARLSEGYWKACAWNMDGFYYMFDNVLSGLDLVEAVEEKWVNLYFFKDAVVRSGGVVHISEEIARQKTVSSIPELRYLTTIKLPNWD